MQVVAMRDVPYYPLGQFQAPTGWRTEISGILNGFATFWNVRRA
jgi:peptide/nickel transport system substrate-binding protein